MRNKRTKKILVALAVFLVCSYILLRKEPRLIRPHIEPQSILINPAATCALIEFNFRGGERWSWLDPYALFTLSDGDAFYTVVSLRSKKIVRDSTWSIIPITAYSQALVGMGSSVFFWSADGRNAAFPGGDGPAYLWQDITECAGEKSASPYSNLICFSSNQSAQCKAVREMID
ncbi:hypothetical protein EJD96_13510 [Herbaspirillum seropedicae]|uniref:hypothetical protein n=1 Tax=Herbaspirillum seropedicae TaxID=964 RepID=UPI00111E0935|nr:hypothetical protein [Herbaspirillum seropedicae]QDD65106.1 hypothetical protein EJD96_13510 [Herbaspirillum seropedicae]